jgi:hypothetical protein
MGMYAVNTSTGDFAHKRMPFIDLVKWNGNPEIAAWKFPSQDLSSKTQLIVNESQEAFLVHGGVYEGPFGAGRHTLSTENLPLLRGLFKLPFGGESPFSAEVWFVNKVTNLDVLWGFPDPIQLQDLELKSFYWFGGKPDEPLPPIHDYSRPLRATGNKSGLKPPRQNHRLVPRDKFLPLDGIDAVLDMLFGGIPNGSL